MAKALTKQMVPRRITQRVAAAGLAAAPAAAAAGASAASLAASGFVVGLGGLSNSSSSGAQGSVCAAAGACGEQGLQGLLRQQLLQKQLLLPGAYRATAGSLGCVSRSSANIKQQQEQKVGQQQWQQQQQGNRQQEQQLAPQQWQHGEILGGSSETQQQRCVQQGFTEQRGTYNGGATTLHMPQHSHGLVLSTTGAATAAYTGQRMDGVAAAVVESAAGAAVGGVDVGQDIVCADFSDCEDFLAAMAAILE